MHIEVTHLNTEERPNGANEDAVDGDAHDGVDEQDATAQLRLRCCPPVPDCRDGRECKEHRVVEAPQLAVLCLIPLGIQV